MLLHPVPPGNAQAAQIILQPGREIYFGAAGGQNPHGKVIVLGKHPGIAGHDETKIKAGGVLEPGKFRRRQIQFPFNGRRQPGQGRPTAGFGGEALHPIGGDNKAGVKRALIGGEFHAIGMRDDLLYRAAVQQSGALVPGLGGQELVQISPHGHADEGFVAAGREV